jgi:hypothetical protein
MTYLGSNYTFSSLFSSITSFTLKWDEMRASNALKLNKVFKLQKRTARIIANVGYRESKKSK